MAEQVVELVTLVLVLEELMEVLEEEQEVGFKYLACLLLLEVILLVLAVVVMDSNLDKILVKMVHLLHLMVL